jgi:hypothetical protein
MTVWRFDSVGRDGTCNGRINLSEFNRYTLYKYVSCDIYSYVLVAEFIGWQKSTSVYNMRSISRGPIKIRDEENIFYDVYADYCKANMMSDVYYKCKELVLY